MERGWYNSQSPYPSVSPTQLGVSVLAALAVHVVLWQILSARPPPQLVTNVPSYVSVKLIQEVEAERFIPSDPDAIVQPEPVIKTLPEIVQPATSVPVDIPADIIDPVPPLGVVELSPLESPNAPPALDDNGPKLIIDTSTSNGPAVDERFRLKNWNGPVHQDLQKLAATTDCFGFETHCAEQRKTLFAAYQVTEEQRAHVQRAPHTGLSSEFYGLSEREIRTKLNVPFAGENGQVIIPFLLTIDGPIWDALHGVNKSCEHKFAGIKGGRHSFKTDCGSYGRADPNAFTRFEQLRDGEIVPFQNLPDKEDE
ncbi:MAG: hypothetical protein ABJG88_05775 [Litorimonas sp.]